MKIALEIKKLALSFGALAAILLAALHAAPAHAQSRLWVSRYGNDASLCKASSPCLTFGRAVYGAGDGGEVACLDSGGFGTFTVTSSVAINCSGLLAAPTTDGGISCHDTAITINAPGKVVTLRGLTLTGFSDTLGCSDDNGILIQAAAAVYIEDCVIENFAQKGILDTRTSGLTKLAIKNTIVRNNGSAGIVAGAAPRNSVVLENVHSVGNAYGIGVATGNNVVISRSVMSENSVAGIEVDPGGNVIVENTKISHNASYGIFSQGTVTLANSDISFNTTSIAGSTFSYGNNRIFDNGAGNAPALISQQ
jgi:hypothetical protein